METCAWRSGLQGRGGGGGGVRQWGGGFLLVPALAMKVQVGWYLDSHYWKKFRLDFSVPKN